MTYVIYQACNFHNQGENIMDVMVGMSNYIT